MVALTPAMALVFGLIGVALILFVAEPIPPDVTAIGVLVALAVFEPWTGVTVRDALAGFASPATLTILAMFILSEGVRRTGVVDRLGFVLSRITRNDERRLLAATVGSTGLAAGIVNNTPVVAVFIPMITGLAERANVSASKLLLPLSYAAMLGGTLTLLGTSTNLLASDLSAELLDHRLGLFEITPLGVLVLVVGLAYLLTIGRWLTPARISPERDFTAEYELESHLSRIRVRESSPLVGDSLAGVQESIDAGEAVVDLLRLERDGESYLARRSGQTVEAGDILVVRGTLQDINLVATELDLRQLSREEIKEADLVKEVGTLVEAIVLPESGFVGETVAETGLRDAFHTTVLAVRRGSTTLRLDIQDETLEAGDTLLLQTTDAALEFLTDEGELLVTEYPSSPLPLPAEAAAPPSLSRKTPYAIGILGAVVLVAALGLVPIVIAALGGVVAMVAARCITASDAYDAVSWNVIFLLAGVLPLGVALRGTGGDALVASMIVAAADLLPLIAVLGLVYFATAVLASVITPVATVVLMIPIAVDTASRLNANGFAFLIAVTFASAGAFMTPIGYQTNLMVYGPGGFRFTDYLRVGGPLQLLLTVVVTGGIVVLYGL